MAAGFESGRYDPELARLMTRAIESAWRQVQVAATSAELARLVLAGAILEAIEQGVREQGLLVAKAIDALAAAVRLTGQQLQIKAGDDAIGDGGLGASNNE